MLPFGSHFRSHWWLLSEGSAFISRAGDELRVRVSDGGQARRNKVGVHSHHGALVRRNRFDSLELGGGFSARDDCLVLGWGFGMRVCGVQVILREAWPFGRTSSSVQLQGYLAHKKTPHLRTLQ